MHDVKAEVLSLARQIVALGVSPETAADVQRILDETETGSIHEEDLDYLRALNARLGGNSGGHSASPEKSVEDDRAGAVDWKARAYQAMQRAKRAERRLKELEATQREAGETSTDRRFNEIRKRFARRYHPNNNRFSGLEATLRAEIFKEFWAEFEEVSKLRF